MAEWSNFPVVDKTTAVQWHAYQICAALRERQTVTDTELLISLPVDKTTNIQDPAYWAGIQGLVDVQSTQFLNSADYPTGYDGMAYAPPYTLPNYTEATFRSAAGLHANGWLRRYKSGASVVSGYGTMQADDIIGSHIFNELYQALNVLLWQKVAGGWAHTTLADLWDGHSGGGDKSWVAAQTGLAAAWADTGNSPIGETDVYYAGQHSLMTDYSAIAQRPHGKLQNLTAVSTAFKRDADYYFEAQGLPESVGSAWNGWDVTFSDLGDGVQDGKWSKVLTDSPAAATTEFKSGSSFGSASLPSSCDAPSGPGIDKKVHGYSNGGGALVVVRWDVTDGFDYVP